MIKSVFKIKLLLIAIIAITFSETTFCMDQNNTVKAAYTVAKPLSNYFTNQVNKNYRNVFLIGGISTVCLCIISAIITSYLIGKIYLKKFNTFKAETVAFQNTFKAETVAFQNTFKAETVAFQKDVIQKRRNLVAKLLDKKNEASKKDEKGTAIAEKDGIIVELVKKANFYKNELLKTTKNFKAVLRRFERLEKKVFSNGNAKEETESVLIAT